MIAAGKGHKDMVDALLSHNCNLDVKDNEGETALMFAANNGHRHVVDALLAHKCNLDLQNNNGETALMIAQSNNHDEVVALIEIQLRRNRNWDRRKALMLVLVGSNYLPSSSPLIYPSSASSEGGAVRVVQTPVVMQHVHAGLTTSSEKVLCDLFLVQNIMCYI